MDEEEEMLEYTGRNESKGKGMYPVREDPSEQSTP
jgi:hypothetical protein